MMAKVAHVRDEEVVQVPYVDHPIVIQAPMAELEMVTAFKRAAAESQPPLPEPTLVFFHRLDNPGKAVVRLLFGEYEIDDPKRLGPLVERARTPLVYKVDFDLVEVYHNHELWLVDAEEIDDQPPTYDWISTTDEYLGINQSRVEPERTGPDPDAVARWRAASGDGDLIAETKDKEEGVDGPPQDH